MGGELKQRAPWVVVTGLDGSGKTTLVRQLVEQYGGHRFRLPYHDFVLPALRRSGAGTPFGDVHTDRLVLAADARLTNYLIREWRGRYRLLVSQRGWMDNYIFGAVQGVSYRQTDAQLRTSELERPSAIVYLIAAPEVAFERIRNDPARDKYETLDFIRSQYRETLRFYHAVRDGHHALVPFAGIPALLVNTSRWTTESVFADVNGWLQELLGRGEAGRCGYRYGICCSRRSAAFRSGAAGKAEKDGS
jgi:thymidylate kinase